MLRAKDPKIWSSIEQEEIEHPSPRKIVDGRTIYRSRVLLHTRWAAHPIITDFGAARFGEPGEMHSGDVMPGIYRAPEVILDMEWDSKIDMWCVGLMVCADSLASLIPMIVMR
jgi:serine/threonine protein kinase